MMSRYYITGLRCCSSSLFGIKPRGLLYLVILQVECDPASLHIPLHRFFSRALAVVCSSQFFSKYHEFDLKAWNIAPKDIMEHPLRALVLSSQISSARLWARYESSVSSAALNYLTPPFCKRMRDLDILLLQVQTDT